MNRDIIKELIKKEIVPYLVEIRQEISGRPKDFLEENEIKGVIFRGERGKDGATPVADVDYHSKKTIEQIIMKSLPKKGKEYFTQADIDSMVGTIMAKLPSKEELKGEDGISPTINYSHIQELVLPLVKNNLSSLRKEVNGTFEQIFMRIKENKQKPMSPEEIRNALESLKGSARMDAKAIKGLEKYITTIISSTGGSGAGGGTGTSIALKHGGLANSSQTILDLIGGGNISISDLGSGRISIDVIQSGIVEINGQTGGVVNLDLESVCTYGSTTSTNITASGFYGGVVFVDSQAVVGSAHTGTSDFLAIWGNDVDLMVAHYDSVGTMNYSVSWDGNVYATALYIDGFWVNNGWVNGDSYCGINANSGFAGFIQLAVNGGDTSNAYFAVKGSAYSTNVVLVETETGTTPDPSFVIMYDGTVQMNNGGQIFYRNGEAYLGNGNAKFGYDGSGYLNNGYITWAGSDMTVGGFMSSTSGFNSGGTSYLDVLVSLTITTNYLNAIYTSGPQITAGYSFAQYWNASTTVAGITTFDAVGTSPSFIFAKGISLPYVAKTSTYTTTLSDYTVNCTSGTFTVNLITAVGNTGKIFVIKNSGVGTITVDANGSQTLDGSTTVTLTTMQSVTIQSNGANWIII